MPRRSLLVLACLAFARLAVAQTSTESPLTGLKLGKVPAALYAQLPKLPEGQGVLVDEVLSGSPAAKAGLRRHDILLSLDGTAVHDGEQFVKLAAATAARGKVPLEVLRRGEKLALRVSLVSPPDSDAPKGMLKPGGPPAVAVHAKNIEGGKMSVTFTFYSKQSSKLESITCSGSPDEIKQKLKDLGEQKRMSPRVQDLADLAVDRLRVLNSPKK